MRTLYTLVITIVFCFSLFAVYNVGYERGKNQQVWKNFREQLKERLDRDSLARQYCNQRVFINAMAAYKYGYNWGIVEYRTYGNAAWELFKKDSIAATKIFK